VQDTGSDAHLRAEILAEDRHHPAALLERKQTHKQTRKHANKQTREHTNKPQSDSGSTDGFAIA
jgi:hypothetical protein